MPSPTDSAWGLRVDVLEACASAPIPMMQGYGCSGRARVPCSFVAQPPPCAPRSPFLGRGFRLPRHSSRRGGLGRRNSRLLGRGFRAPPPLVGAGYRVHRPSLFHLFCCGAFAAPLLTVSLPRPHRIAGLFRPFGAVALVGLLRRERPARQGARPCGSLASLGTAVSLRGFFFGYRLEPRAGVQGVSPLAQACEVCPPAPLLECPPLEDIFCLARGARGSRFLLGAYAPAPLAGACLQPPAPLEPRRGERFLMGAFIAMPPNPSASVFHGIGFGGVGFGCACGASRCP